MTVGIVIFHKIKPMPLGELPSVLKLGCARLFYKRKAGLESLLAAAYRSPLALARPPARRPVWSTAVAPWPWAVGGACSWGPPKRSGEGRGGVCVYSALCPLRLAAHNLKPQSLPCSLWTPGTAPSFVPSCRWEKKVPTASSSRLLPFFFFVVFHALPTPLQ